MYILEHKTSDADITGCIDEESPSSLSIVCTANKGQYFSETYICSNFIVEFEFVEIDYHCNDKQMLSQEPELL